MTPRAQGRQRIRGRTSSAAAHPVGPRRAQRHPQLEGTATRDWGRFISIVSHELRRPSRRSTLAGLVSEGAWRLPPRRAARGHRLATASGWCAWRPTSWTLQRSSQAPRADVRSRALCWRRSRRTALWPFEVALVLMTCAEQRSRRCRPDDAGADELLSNTRRSSRSPRGHPRHRSRDRPPRHRGDRGRAVWVPDRIFRASAGGLVHDPPAEGTGLRLSISRRSSSTSGP